MTVNLRRITQEAFNEGDACPHRYHRCVSRFRRRLVVGGSPHTPPEAIMPLLLIGAHGRIKRIMLIKWFIDC
jgi:hypothetical protein